MSSVTAGNLYFPEMVLKSDLSGYVRRCLLGSLDYFDVLDKPPIHVLLNEEQPFGLDGSPIRPSQHLKTLSVLLECGQDPNESYHSAASKGFLDCLRAGLFKLFLEHGTDPNALVYQSGFVEAIYSTTWVDFLFTIFYVEYPDVDFDAYLETLKAFLESKPELNRPIAYIMSDEEVRQNWASGHVGTAFFEGMANQGHGGYFPTKRALYKVTCLVLSKLRNAEWPINWATIHDVFYAKRAVRIRAINPAVNAESTRHDSGKQ
ncbi:hypothetical protein PG988_011809 [Apiospora saccharicola]